MQRAPRVFSVLISCMACLPVANNAFADRIFPFLLSNASTPQQIKTSENSDQSQLPRDDIRQFVTAIAVIHHYYIQKTENNKLFDNAIRGMVNGLDPHSLFLDASELQELDTTVSGRFVGIGIELTLDNGLLKVISPLEDSPATKAGIQPEDVILKIDGTLVRNMDLNDAVKKIKGEKGTKVILTLVRKGKDKPFDVLVTRDEVKLISVKSKLLDNNYGYVRITFFQGPVEKQMRIAIEKLQTQAHNKLSGLVLDLRNNPGGLLDISAKIADDFLDSNTLKKFDNNIVSTKGRIESANMSIKATPGDLINGIPMIVLINGGSASASEIVAGALQDYKRAVIMGTRSFGKGSVQTVLPISNTSAIKLTTALYYTPAGQVIQARGIIPDVTVPKLSVEDLDTDKFIVDEADFENHLLNEKGIQLTRDEMLKRKVMLQSQLKLAKEDYQLYEALMMLEGLSATK